MNDDKAFILDKEEITKLHFDKTVKIIVQASNKLKCSNIIRAKALTIYHYFKRCVHEAEYDNHIVAAAALSLSIKFFEEPIEFDAIIICIFSMLGIFPSVLDDDFKEVRKNLTVMESLMLRMVEFSLEYVLVHQYLIYFMEDVKEFLAPIKVRDTFVSVCMQLADDFYLSQKCLNYKSSEIAAVIILIGFYYMGINFSSPDCYLEEWIKGLETVSPATRCNIIEDIFEVTCIQPTADIESMKSMELSRTM